MSQLQTVAAQASTLYINATNSETLLESKTHGNINHPHFYNWGIFDLVTRFSISNRAALTFSLNESVKTHYILAKGLIEFYRPKELVFNYNATEKTVSINLQSNHLPQLEKLFAQVSGLLHSEITFKSKLKQMIAFEKRYREEALLIYKA